MENLSWSSNPPFEEALNQFKSIHPTISIESQPIGQGGMKTVYSAFDEQEKQKLVVKVIKFAGSDSEKRVKREIDILNSLSSPYFPKIYDKCLFNISGQELFVISESFVSGMTLREYENNKIEFHESIKIGKELLRALMLVHEKQLVHRDVKPENIMITENKEIVLLDFGIARDLMEDSITSDLAIFGPMTIGYAAPEQVANKKRIISQRTDLFSWAIVFTELLTGENPLTKSDTSKQKVLQRTLNFSTDNINWGNIPEELIVILQKNLSPQVHRRSNSAEEILLYLSRKGF